MLFQIDFDAATALYRQLVDQVSHAAAAGTLKPGDLLPTIRPLARQLHLNRNTVAKAYSELEHLRVIKTIPGKGCFLEPVNSPLMPKVRDTLVAAKIDAALITAYQLQINAAAFSVLVAERIKLFAQKIPKGQKITEGHKWPSDEPRSQSTIAAPAPTADKRPTSTTIAHTPTRTVPTPAPPVSSTNLEGWTPFAD